MGGWVGGWVGGYQVQVFLSMLTNVYGGIMSAECILKLQLLTKL